MLFAYDYNRIRTALDAEYPAPREIRFRRRQFRYVTWRNIKVKNFSYVMRALSENGPSTISDIARKDPRSGNKDKRKSRIDVYSVVISGDKKKNARGLKDKRIVTEHKSPQESERPKKYKLTIFGIFYAIHLFSDKTPKMHESLDFSEAEEPIFKNSADSGLKSILELMVEKYKDELPLIFGKWKFLKNEVKSLVYVLVLLSHGSFGLDSSDDILYTVWPPKYKFRKSLHGIYSEEITLWFYNYLCMRLGPRKFYRLMSKDREIFEWYSKHIDLLYKANKEDKLRILCVRSILDRDFDSVEKYRRYILALHGVK